jgi:hypothetical protein
LDLQPQLCILFFDNIDEMLPTLEEYEGKLIQLMLWFDVVFKSALRRRNDCRAVGGDREAALSITHISLCV